MKTYVPNYYKNFKCIADKCKHSCCIGWEIDIDEETLEMYKNTKGKFSRKLKSGIEYCDDYACFKLDGKGRCVFLNEKGLCDIILNFGENALCQICNDHPRFRNFYTDRTEIGLGICCEEAGRIILGQDSKFSLIEIDNDGIDDTNSPLEKEIIEYRDAILDVLQDDSLSLNNKIYSLINLSGYDFPQKTVSQWVDILMILERLDEYWTVLLNELKECDISEINIPNEYEKPLTNLLVYFAFRHLNDYDYLIKTVFIVISYLTISFMCKLHIAKHNKLFFEDIIDYARMYSSEIEYSDENVEKIIDSI